MKGKIVKTKKKNEFEQVLIKKALGYDATEVIEEYSAGDEGEIKLIKKKITKKNVPPDLSALKMLLESQNLSVTQMTDEELLLEREKLLNELKNQGEQN